MKKFAFYILLYFLSLSVSAQLLSPTEFLGYELGDRFTRHHKVVEYFEHIAQNRPNIVLHTYGETYENRPLIYAIISSPENISRLEEIRTDNLKRIGYLEGKAKKNDIAMVWLSYNIHGNEASSTEAAIKTVYALADESNKSIQEWLKNTVVIMDPCVNPDGRDRYANFYAQYGNKNFNPNGEDIEHHEPWPGGRPNHYLFDLNRDWAWQTQIESASRSKVYHKWMPHIHVDFHEQGINNPYYFAPAAEPQHEIITPWQREFQVQIGRNHAKYFDKEGWLYFSKEEFDLLYPSYGDTYPTFNGAIGMTYEQAGHSYAGLGIITEYGDTLTLKDRINHHYTTGISTIEIASKNANNLVREFEIYFTNNVSNPTGEYKTYIVKNDNQDKINTLTKFLDRHHITYGSVNSTKTYKGFSYKSGNERSFSVSDEDLIISTYQPSSRLLTAFFEPKTKLSDTLTYDITAWAIPYAHGLDAYALADKVIPSKEYEKKAEEFKSSEKTYAYIAKYNSIQDVEWLSYLLNQGVNVRVTHKRLVINGNSYDRGSLVITQRNNEHVKGGLDKLITESAKEYNRNPVAVTTGFADTGVDLGSSSVAKLAKPKIAVLTGEQTSSLSYGEIWHYFERQVDYPITSISTDYFGRVNLSDYTVLIVPNGYYKLFDDSNIEKVTSWIREGGKLIVIGSGINAFKEKGVFTVKEYNSEKDKKKEEPSKEDQLKSFEILERDNLKSSIFGAIFKVNLDNSHPLAYGYGTEYHTIKTNAMRLSFLEQGSNVGVLKGDAKPVSGFAGSKAVEKLDDSLVFGVQQIGRGSAIYLVDNPLFRGFWENGKLLFSNAVFMVGN